MAVLPFYRVDFPIDQLNHEFTYREYSQGKEIGSRVVTESEYIALKKVLEEEKAGWKYDITTYAPEHIFSASNMKIDCSESTIVVNFQVEAETSWEQISKKNIKKQCPSIQIEKK